MMNIKIFYNNCKWNINFKNCDLLSYTPITNTILYSNYILVNLFFSLKGKENRNNKDEKT